MNKQELASKIWESANKMRSKIEANEYKDYILGFIFYKFLSEKEERWLRDNDYEEDDIKKLNEDDERQVEYIQEAIGYFIAYEDLFSTWIAKGKNFDVSDVRDALSAFSRLINPHQKKVFENIFKTLETGLSKLGDSSGAQTKAIRGLIELIKDIPMDGKQDYDVLGFIYEYLISMFAANAGKKAGEFYTPHEVSVLMSEIVAHHLKDRREIKIYDPTSGSGSLLINIGKSIAKHMDNENNIKYYAQELKENTYNLTRMNLVMRNILPENIVTRNADTLEDDWPIDDNSDCEPLYVDAVVSNPPYSQNWDTKDKENDPRYANFGLAPKSKADYAFLLHDLYHIKPYGIMTIVLPHGVLFRGNEEGKIRKNLIEGDHIETIIGLPPNIFFGTNIPTIIMVLRQKRDNNDVLIIDASKEFIKVGKNNQLQASNIKKIVDTVIKRNPKDNKFARLVSKEEIRKNEYNLNIPRYIDSSEEKESFDIYASMFGGIPKNEINQLKKYWNALPGLKEQLFIDNGSPYMDIQVKTVKKTILESEQVNLFKENYRNKFKGFNEYLRKELIDNIDTVNISKEETIIGDDIFSRISELPLVDIYESYQILDNSWIKVSNDIEVIQTEGRKAIKQVDPNMVIKKKKNIEEEVQDGWIGHIIPFELVQKTILKEDYDQIVKEENRLSEIQGEYEDIIESFSEEEKESSILNDDNTSFITAEVTKELKRIFEDVESDEINILKGYIKLLDNKASKSEKVSYIENHTEVSWGNIESNKDGTYGKGKVASYLKELQSNFTFEPESFEGKVKRVGKLLEEEKTLKAKVKKSKEELHNKTKNTIENLDDNKALQFLEMKWIEPLTNELYKIPNKIIKELVDKVEYLANKYSETYADTSAQIRNTEKEISSMIDELDGNEFDMKGLSKFKTLLMGN